MLISILDNFFSICSWWMLPLFLISWLLGGWFWNMFRGNPLRENIEALETKVSELESDLASKIETITNLEAAKAELRSKHEKLEMTYFAEKETRTNLEEELIELKKKYLDD